MKRLILLAPLLLFACSSTMIREEHELSMFPTKIDIPYLDVAETVSELSGGEAARFADLGSARVYKSVYRRTGEDSSVTLYVCRTHDPLSAYGLLSSLLPVKAVYSARVEGYCSSKEGVIRRGDLCVFVSASNQYPLSGNDIADILSFASLRSPKKAEIFPAPVLKLSSKEMPFAYSTGSSERFCGIDSVYSGALPKISAAGEIFYSERVSAVEASRMLEKMVSGRIGDVIVLESSGYDLLCIKDRSGSMTFIQRKGSILCGITKAASLESGRSQMGALSRLAFPQDQ